MKKLVKSSLIAILLVVVAIAVTGCGSKTSKTYNAFSKAFSGDSYTIELEEYNVDEDEEKITLTIAKKGNDICQDVKSEGQHATIMIKDDTTYLIMHDEEMYIKSEGRDETILPEEDEVILSKDEIEALKIQEYKTGKEKIDDKEYEYEEYYDSENEITERYYFEKNELKYIKSIDSDGEEEIIKIVKLTSSVDDSIFNIPTDYYLVEED
ncbi:MAG: hypothetical protein ACI4UX_05105 [Clostridia bacterium]